MDEKIVHECIHWTMKYENSVKSYRWIIVCRDSVLNQIQPIENRIYREEFSGKKCKTAILLYCFHTAGVLHIFMPYNLLGPGISLYRKAKIIVKRKPNYEIGWFHN